MIQKKFNENWYFWRETNAFALVWNIPEEAVKVNIPHDAMIEKESNPNSNNKGNTGYRDGEIYNYVKLFEAKEEHMNKIIMLKFEGIYMNASVYINGQLAGKCPNGYTTFYVQINDYLKYGEENEIRISVRNGAMTNSRWYSGGGIYRDVYLLISDLTYILPDGIQAITESIDLESATLNISTEVKNSYHNPIELKLETSIQDSRGNIVAKDTIPFVIFQQEERKSNQRIIVNNPKLWAEYNPELYTCISRIYKDNKLIDESISLFGIRKLQLDSKRGLRVNGESIKLRGACIHHDSGLLGAATYYDAQYRQIKLLKDAGFNAVRISHQPIAQPMLRACDELGMYVMEEAFDMWNRCKSDYDYGMYFSEWWEKDITAMVRKNFNHPSVILYSIGNEIPEIATAQGSKLCHDICKKIKSLDNTRYTLASINGIFASGDAINTIISDVISDENNEGSTEGNVNNFMSIMDKYLDKIVVHPEITKRLDKACAYTDIAGYNYMTARYEEDIKRYPNRIIVGSETYPPEIARNWSLVNKYNNIIGDFTWTGWDYIGEAGVGIPAYKFGEGGFGANYPCQLAYCGDIDITGFRRPLSYYREIVFGIRKKPYISVQNPFKYGKRLIKTPWVMSDSISSWTYNDYENKPLIIEVYSAGDEVELLCNGKLIGRKKAGKEVGFVTYFDTIYIKGTLTAVSYENGVEIGRTELRTAGNKYKLVLKEDIKNEELIYVAIELQDENGVLVTNDCTVLNVSIIGEASVVGFGSANPKTKYNYNGLVTETFQGRALLIIKKNKEAEEIIVKVSSDKNIQEKIIIYKN